MPSQASHPQSQPSPLCLPLLKFSYATVSNDHIVPIPWIHLSSKNALFAIFETSLVQQEDGRIEQRQTFKVLKDPEVMEELDLSALSTEANRALTQTPNPSSTNIPFVAVIVKVPMIAIKYPLANGQVRRFQIRFGKNEDYYEAMKMLARANVPTVEAGTFPSFKPQPAQLSAPAQLVVPSDSASQIGVEAAGPSRFLPNAGGSSVSNIRHAEAAMPIMAPPQMYPAQASRPEYRRNDQIPAVRTLQADNLPEFRHAYAKSNISLSTDTTLVPGKQDSRTYAMPPRSFDAGANLRQGQAIRGDVQQTGTPAIDQLSRPPVSRQEDILRPPPSRQQLSPIPDCQDDVVQLRSTRSTTKRAVGPQQREEKPPLQDDDGDKPEPSTKMSEKSKGKRPAAGSNNNNKKTPAAKKPRATASAKSKGKAAQKETPVPTVEELLRTPGYSLRPDAEPVPARTRRRPQQTNKEVGLEPSKGKNVEIAESEYSTQAYKAISPELGQAATTTTTRMTRAASRALSCLPTNIASGLQAQASMLKAALPPCTPADQIIGNPPIPASPAVQGYNHPKPFQARDQTSDRNPSLHLPSINHPNHPAAQGDSATSAFRLAQECMAMDENYDLANADSRLEAWNSLPTPVRMTALNHHFCDLIMKDSFVELVKQTSLFWEGAILEGRMMRLPGERAGDEAIEEEEEDEDV